MSSDDTNAEQELSIREQNELLELLDEIFKTVDAKDIKIDAKLTATVYGFRYQFDMDKERISYRRIDGDGGFIEKESLVLFNCPLAPFYEYVKNEDNDDYIPVRSSDPFARMFLLCPGDFFIEYENCLARQCLAHKTANMSMVVEGE